MAKYSFEFKKKIVLDYLDGKGGAQYFLKNMNLFLTHSYSNGFFKNNYHLLTKSYRNHPYAY